MMTPADLKAKREAMGLTQTELAAAIGVTWTTVWRWEKGRVPISRTVERLLTLLAREENVRP